MTSDTMSLAREFEELTCWQDARSLTREIYSTSKRRPFYKDYALRDQIRRSCISITSNIAEGFERNSAKAFRHHLSIAKGAAGEVSNQLYVALDEDYILKETFEELQSLTRGVIRQIGGLMRHLNTRRSSPGHP